MKKRNKHTHMLVLTVMILLVFACLMKEDAQAKEVVKEYEAGASITATLYDDGSFEMIGTGATTNWSRTGVPWYGEKAQIVSVEIGEGITSVDADAFYGCANLEEARIASTVTATGGSNASLFAGCAKLTKITFAYGMEKIPDGICRGVSSLQTIIYEAGIAEGETVAKSSIKEIGDSAFRGCAKLTGDVIPDTVETIGQYAFYGCNSLTTVDLPDMVTQIGRYAFCNCQGLTDLTLPSGLEMINDYTFSGCKALTSISLPEGLTTLQNYAFNGCSGLTEICFPGSLVTIGSSGAFQNCTNLTKVIFSDDTTKVNDNICRNMTTLKTVEWKGDITEIGQNAFYNCSALESFTFPEGLEKIGSAAFYKCSSLKEITLPDSVTEIGQNVFYQCSAATDLVLSAGLTTIPYQAFYQCSSLTELVIPEGVEKIESYAFRYCNKLASVSFPSTIVAASNSSAFAGCQSLTQVTFAEGFETIPAYICKDLTALETVHYLGEPKTIGEYAFYNCQALSQDAIPESATSIMQYAYYNCDGITDLLFSEHLKQIGSGAFSNCDGLIKVRIPNGLETIGNYGIFGGSSQLETVIFAEGTTKVPAYICQDMAALQNVIYEGASVSVNEIGAYAFRNCTGISENSIPENVEKIGVRSFAGCKGVKKLSFSQVKEIGTEAFYNCSGMTELNLPEGLETMGEEAFGSCTMLTEVRIPSTVKTVDYYGVFPYCDNLKKVIFAYGMEEIPAYICKNMSALETIIFEKDPEEGQTTKIQKIGAYAFYNCSALNQVVIPDSVEAIDEYAFAYCTNLQIVYIMGDQLEMDARAFYVNYLTDLLVVSDSDDIKNLAWAYSNRNAIFPVSSYKAGEKVTAHLFEDGGIIFSGVGRMFDFTESTVPWKAERAKINYMIPAEDVPNIGAYALYGTQISHVVLRDELTEIGTQAFGECNSLYHIEIGEGITAIGAGAFQVSIPMKTKLISDNEVATAYNWSADNRDLDESIVGYKLSDTSSAVLFGSELHIVGYGNCDFDDGVPWKDVELTKVVVHQGIKSIGDEAFYKQEALDSVEIAQSVRRIGRAAFSNCSLLTKVTLPKLLSELGDSAFESCESLVSVNLKDTELTEIPSNCFKDCSKLTGVDLPAAVEMIGSSAFWGCSNMTELKIPGTLSNVGTSSGFGPFGQNCNLKSVTFAENATSVPAYLLSGCENLEKVQFSDSITEIGRYAFYNCKSLLQATLPTALSEIGEYTFMGCSSLVVVSLGETELETIGDYCFADCSALRKIELPQTIKSICDHAFYNCTSVGNFILPEGIQTLEGNAFTGCDKITEIRIPRSLNSCNAGSQGPFAGCNNLKKVSFATKTRKIPNYLFAGCDSIETVEFQDTITEIGYSAFSGCSQIGELAMPQYLTVVGAYAFKGCSNMNVTEWSEYLEQIGAGAFYGCEKLDTIVFSENLTRIESDSFGKTALQTVVLPYKVTYIGSGAFDTSTLTSISIPAQTTSIYTNAFGTRETPEELTITGDTGSYAETYAKEKGYTFVTGNAAETITLSKTEQKLSVGDNCQLNVSITPIGTTGAIVWSSSDEDVVTVTPSADVTKATIRAIAAGEADITVTCQEKTATCHVTANKYVKSLKLSKEYAVITDYNGQMQLNATVTPIDAENAELVWVSANPEIATVDQDGLVTAVSNGLVKIYARTIDGAMQTSCLVSVNMTVDIERIAFTRKNVFLSGGTKQLDVIVEPAVAQTQNAVKFSSSDEGIATVDENGLLTAVADGTCDITVQTRDGKHKDVCHVTIQAVEVPVTGITISENSVVLDDAVRTAVLHANVVPQNADVQNIIWESEDESIVSVDENGTVRAQNCGMTYVHAISLDGEYEAKCAVTVKELIKRLEIRPLEVWMKIGERAQLTPTLVPDSQYQGEIEWYSTNSKIATVDQSGCVTAIANGDAYIKCHTLDGSDLLAACKVNVGEGYIKMESISLTKEAYTLFVGEHVKLPVTIKPDNTTRKNVQYSTSNASVATVSADGNVYAANPGSAVITITSVYEPQVTASCQITVKQQDEKPQQPGSTTGGQNNQIQNPPAENPQPDVVKKPGKVTLKSVTAGKKQLVAKWKKISADGYQLQYAQNKKFKSAKNVTIKSSKTVTKKIKKLKSGKRYYLRIRAYKTSNGKKVYGSWSKTKSVKIK